jgi:tetratricopeptide (TPR) repeat protein
VEHLSPGTLLDSRFEIISVIAEDASGVLYTAKHLLINKNIKLKLLHAHREQDMVAVDSFRREAALGPPHSSNSAPALDAGIFSSGRHYIVWDDVMSKVESSPCLPTSSSRNLLLPFTALLVIGASLIWATTHPVETKIAYLKARLLARHDDGEAALRDRRELKDMLESQHHLSEAADQGEMILQAVLRRSKPTSYEAIAAIKELGDSYAKYGNSKKARELYERALLSAKDKIDELRDAHKKVEQLPFRLQEMELLTRLHGPRSEEFAEAEFEAGSIYDGLLHDTDKAYRMYEDCWQIAEQLPAANPNRAWYAYYLAGLCADRHQQTRARSLREKAYSLMMNGPAPNFGPGSTYGNVTAITLMEDYLTTGDANKAAGVLDAFISANKDHEDLIDRSLCSRLWSMGQQFQQQRKYKQAQQLYELVLAQEQKTKRGAVFEELTEMAILQQLQKNYKALEHYLRKAMTVQEQQSKQISPHLYHWLGYALYSQKEYTQALPLYRKSLKMMYAIPNYDIAELGFTESEMVACLRSVGLNQEADLHDAKFQKLLPSLRKRFQK